MAQIGPPATLATRSSIGRDHWAADESISWPCERPERPEESPLGAALRPPSTSTGSKARSKLFADKWEGALLCFGRRSLGSARSLPMFQWGPAEHCELPA